MYVGQFSINAGEHHRNLSLSLAHGQPTTEEDPPLYYIVVSGVWIYISWQ